MCDRLVSRWLACAFAFAVILLAVVAGVTLTGSAGASARPLGDSLPQGATSTATPGCGPVWSIVSSPNQGSGSSNLTSVAALSSSDVWAAGYFTTTGGLNQTLFERWDGTQWSIAPGSTSGAVYGLDAVSPTDIWAVGYTGVFPGPFGTLVQHWDGAQWSVVPSPNPGFGGKLLGVSALSATNAWAVGVYYTGSTATQTLILHWDGVQWTQVPGADPALSDELASVFAVSPDDVWAAGAYVNNRQYFTMIEHWDGTQWSVVSSPSIQGYILSMSGTSGTDVWAAGYFINSGVSETLTEHWNGAQWSVVPSPSPDTLNNFIQGIIALAPDDAWAVGSGVGTLAIHWDGVQWAVVSSPNVEGLGGFSAVGALSPTDVWAVGDYYDTPNRVYKTLIEHYASPCAPTATATAIVAATPTPTCASAWQIVDSPNPSSSTDELAGITALSPNDVWTVGLYEPTPTAGWTLTLHWDGSAWSHVPSPNPYPNRQEANDLLGVAGISTNDVWAVGYTYSPNPSSHYLTLIEHWDGSQWSVVPSPNRDPIQDYLYAVSAVASNDVWAVGYDVEGVQFAYDRTLTEHWDGSQWSIIPSPNVGTDNNYLFAVSAISTNDVWGVGNYMLSSGGSRTLIEHWDGSQWQIVPSPNPSGAYGVHLYGVSAVATNDIWAVGAYSSNVEGTLTEHWDGTQWSIVPSPNMGPQHSEFEAVSAISTNDVWAVGYYCCGGAPAITLAEHWDGSQWSVMPSPNVSGHDNYLWGVAALSPDDVWADGIQGNVPYQMLTLMKHYSPECSQPTPAPTFTPTRTPTRSATPTVAGTETATPPSLSPTTTASRTITPLPTYTPTLCPMTFSDVHPADYFYEAVRYLYCHGAISGYADGTFRPFNNTTRGQLSKIVVLAEGLPIDTQGGPHFSDVQLGSAFYDYVETAYNNSLISGYSDGTFRPGNNVTRGQLCKIVVLAQQWQIDTIGGPHFSDVPPTDTFYAYIETAYNHSVISGYSDGTFRPGNNATRGQIAKIVYNAISRGLGAGG